MELLYPYRLNEVVVLTQTFQQHVARAQANGWNTEPGGPSKVFYYGGIDWAKLGGCAIRSAIAAPVTKVENQGLKVGYGLHVRQQVQLDGVTWEVIYGHLRLDSVTVKVGTMLQPGVDFGWMDNTGNSTGDHLHFEVRRNGTPVDPMPMMTWSLSQAPSDLIREIPELPCLVVVATPYLNVRQKPDVSLPRVGILETGEVVPVIAVLQVGKSIWAKIGYNQYCAMLYGGTQYARWQE